jgi:hypothetical protein
MAADESITLALYARETTLSIPLFGNVSIKNLLEMTQNSRLIWNSVFDSVFW